MTSLNKLKEAWQCQSFGNLENNPDKLLSRARFERRIYVAYDLFIMVLMTGFAVSMLLSALQDIGKNWPWLIYTASIGWVAGFMLLQHMRRRRVNNYTDTVLGHVNRSIQDVEQRIRQDQYIFWWYTFPIAFGCIVPTIITSAIDFYRTGEPGVVVGLIVTLVFFSVVFAFVHLVIKYAGRAGLQSRLKELDALRALRDTLTEELKDPA